MIMSDCRVQVVYRKRLPTMLLLLLALVYALNASVVRINSTTLQGGVPLHYVMDTKLIKIASKWGPPINVFSVSSNVIYVYTSFKVLLRGIWFNHTLSISSYTTLQTEPIWINESSSRVFVVTSNGYLLQYNKGLVLLSKDQISERPLTYMGREKGYAYFTDNEYVYIFHNNKVSKKIKFDNNYVYVIKSGKIIKIPITKIYIACGITTQAPFKVYYMNGYTIVVMNIQGGAIKVAKLTLTKSLPTLISCNKYQDTALVNSLNDIYLVTQNDTDVVIRALTNEEMPKVVLFPPLTVQEFNYLGIYNDTMGSSAYVFKINNNLVAARTKDRITMLIASNVLSCVKEPLLCISLSQEGVLTTAKLYFLPDVSQPYTILKIKLSKSFIKLTKGTILSSYLKSMDSIRKYHLNLGINNPSIAVEVPSGLYMLIINTEVGRVVEFVPAPPPSWDFDPLYVPIEISPDIIVPYVFNLEIKVIDSQTKEPLQGALITITGTTVRGKRVNIGPLITNAEGIVKVKLEKGSYIIKITHMYYKTKLVRVVLNSDKKLVVPLVVKGSKVLFLVQSKGAPPLLKKGPIPNATIHIQGPLVLTLKTDKNGEASAILRPGVYEINVTAPLHKPYTSTLTVNPSVPTLRKVIEMQPILYNLVLTVVDAITKRPVTPNLVKITALDLPNNPSLAISNPPTNVITAKVPPGNYSIYVVAKNYKPFKRIYNIQNNTSITIKLYYKTIRVKILVYDELKRLVDKFNVTLYNEYLGVKMHFTLTTQSNTVDLPPGLYKIKVTAPGYEPLVTELNIDENTKVIQLTIAHKTIPVTIKITTNDKMLYDYIYKCKGSIRGGPLLKPIPLPTLIKPKLETEIRLPKGTYQASVQCFSITNKLAATGTTTFTVPLQTTVEVPIKPIKVNVMFQVLDVRNNRPIPRATIKIFYKDKLIGEGITSPTGTASIPVNIYYLGKQVKVTISAPGYQTFTDVIVLTQRVPSIYLKPAPTIIEILLGNPILIIVIVFAAGAGAYLISTFLGGSEEEEVFEELV